MLGLRDQCRVEAHTPVGGFERVNGRPLRITQRRERRRAEVLDKSRSRRRLRNWHRPSIERPSEAELRWRAAFAPRSREPREGRCPQQRGVAVREGAVCHDSEYSRRTRCLEQLALRQPRVQLCLQTGAIKVQSRCNQGAIKVNHLRQPRVQLCLQDLRHHHTRAECQSRSIKVNQSQSRSIKVNQGQSRSITCGTTVHVLSISRQ